MWCLKKTYILSKSICIGPLPWWLECSPMIRDTGVQSQVKSYQRLKKWYLMPPCLTLSIIRWGSRVKWNNPGNGVAPSPTPRCSSYWKRSLRVTLDGCRQLYFYLLAQGEIQTGSYYLEYPDYYLHRYCYIHNISPDAIFTLLQVYHVEPRSLHKTSNWTLYLIYRDRLFWFH